MKTICKTAAVLCAAAILGQVGRCDLGGIGVLECLAGVVLWSTLGVVC